MEKPLSPIENSDSHLVRQAKAGDFDAFESLVVQYERRVYTLALRILGSREEAEEAVQEAFLSALKNLKGFREEASFHTWLVRIVTNHALKILRKRKGLSTVSMDAAPDDDGLAEPPRPQYIAEWTETPFEAAQREETERILEEALEELDEPYRLVFLLRDVEGLSTEETAQALGIGISNAKVRLLRARLMLREKLTRIFGDDETRAPISAEHRHP